MHLCEKLCPDLSENENHYERVAFKEFLNRKLNNPRAFGITQRFEMPRISVIEAYISENLVQKDSDVVPIVEEQTN